MLVPEKDLGVLLRTLRPVLHPETVCFCAVPADVDVASCIGFFRETEGVSAIVPEAIAVGHGWPIAMRAAWITLTAHSDLEAVGLTAAVAGALAAAGISCNVVAAVRHDHLFVPAEQGEAALAVLKGLQDS